MILDIVKREMPAYWMVPDTGLVKLTSLPFK
jgi:hypothetical protein